MPKLRRDIQRREPHGIKPAFDPEVFRARFALLRRGDTLTDADRARLDKLFDTHPRLKAGGPPRGDVPLTWCSNLWGAFGRLDIGFGTPGEVPSG